MNFLSHYYYDRKQDDPYFNLGLILPDLLRNFVPGSRIEPKSKPFDLQTASSLNEGCITHIESDKRFHAWETFKSLMQQVTQEIRKSKYPIAKDFFISHIFIELLLDRSLLLRHQDLASELYSDFEQVENQALRKFLAKYEFHKFEQFEYGFSRFMDVRYLEHYRDPQIILYSTERICTKMKLPTFSKGQKNVLLHIIDALDVNIVEATKELEELLQ